MNTVNSKEHLDFLMGRINAGDYLALTVDQYNDLNSMYDLKGINIFYDRPYYRAYKQEY